MRLELDKQYGPALLNLFRQAAMTAVPVVRPIAFSVGNNSNVIDASDATVEDMTGFIHNVMSSQYFTNADNTSELITCQLNIAASFSTQQLERFGVLTQENKVLLHTISPTYVTIHFRQGTGNYSAKQNVAFLEDSKVDTKHLVVVPSRHSAIDNFTFKEIESEDKYIVDITVESKTITENKIFEYTLGSLEKSVSDLRQKLLQS